jgi:hypothetical protein
MPRKQKKASSCAEAVLPKKRRVPPKKLRIKKLKILRVNHKMMT